MTPVDLTNQHHQQLTFDNSTAKSLAWSSDSQTSLYRMNWQNQQVEKVLAFDSAIKKFRQRSEVDIQGINPVIRGQNYFVHLKHYYGKQIHRFMLVPNVGHNSLDIFSSATGQAILFE